MIWETPQYEMFLTFHFSLLFLLFILYLGDLPHSQQQVQARSSRIEYNCLALNDINKTILTLNIVQISRYIRH